MTSNFDQSSFVHRDTQDTRLPALYPMIYSDSPEPAESLLFRHGDGQDEGLVAKADLPAAFLSMSGYKKEAKDYETTSQPSQEPMYLTYAQPGYSQPHVPLSVPYARHTANQAPYSTSALFQPRATFEEPHLNFPNARSRQIPEIISYTPEHGSQGTQLFVSVMSTYDVESCLFQVMFATRECRPNITKMVEQGSYYQYMLEVTVPPFSSTGWINPQVPLQVRIQDSLGSEIGVVDVGPFTYADNMQQQQQVSTPGVSRKRKMSIDSSDMSKVPSKRTSAQQLRLGGAEPYDAPSYVQQPAQTYLQQVPLASESISGNLMPSYSRAPSQSGYQQLESPRRGPHHLSTSSTSSLSQLRGLSPQTPNWSPSNAAINRLSKSPNLSATSVPRLSSASSPSITVNPPLIRTSTLPQTPSPAATPAASSSSASFNPYEIYPHKAVLKINGNLDAMTEDWTEGEGESKRRLVQFWRDQSGSIINTNFKPVAPEDRQPNSICISCIWWEAKKECYVTSVDTIFLLESLVSVRFTVEEKNRIRRNLEGFRPMTVSKGKSDSEDFFKLIMGFPNPKPRNIEKDVKVFPWKILAHALKKIIGKYSASYSSTASAIATPSYSAYNAAAQSEIGSDLLPTASPHSAPDTTCSPYVTGLHAARVSPHVSRGHLSIPYSSTGPAMLQAPSPSLPSYPTSAPLSYHYIPQTQMSGSSGPVQAMMGQPPQGSWDFSPFIENNMASGAPPMQNLYYTRNDPNMDQMTHRHTSSGP